MKRRLLYLLLFLLSFLRCQAPLKPSVLAHSLYFPSVRIGHWSLKKGLGTHFLALCDTRRMGAAWQYNWDSNGDLAQCPRVENVPMVYSAYFQNLLTSRQETLGGNSQYIMGYNEPDRSEQANITPEAAAVLWRELELFYPRKLLVSPAVSQLDQGWLQQFYDSYHTLYGEAPRIDAVAGHCYYDTCDEFVYCARGLIRYAEQWGVKVWITEFAPIRGGGFDEATASQASRCVIRWLEATPEIERYAWFATRLSGDEPWVNSVDDWCLLINHETNRITRWGRIYAMGGSDG